MGVGTAYERDEELRREMGIDGERSPTSEEPLVFLAQGGISKQNGNRVIPNAQRLKVVLRNT